MAQNTRKRRQQCIVEDSFPVVIVMVQNTTRQQCIVEDTFPVIVVKVQNIKKNKTTIYSRRQLSCHCNDGTKHKKNNTTVYSRRLISCHCSNGTKHKKNKSTKFIVIRSIAKLLGYLRVVDAMDDTDGAEELVHLPLDQ
ncbi:hypothetical protein TNCV_1044361 [Trichonephila clavipes]|nr:hypothetical protein TNCV_1044361 [Trichonephila clavipes]